LIGGDGCILLMFKRMALMNLAAPG